MYTCISHKKFIAFPTIIKVESEHFQSENVNITLNWTQANNEFYDIDVIPRAPTHYAESTTVELTLLYNVHYNINIVAFLCEFNRTNTIEFLYGTYISNNSYSWTTFIIRICMIITYTMSFSSMPCSTTASDQ